MTILVTLLHSFTPISEADVIKLIKSYPVKSCLLDSLPVAVFREVYMTMIPLLTTIVNQSLTTAQMPSVIKEAMITPILRKPQLDQDLLISHLNFPFPI